MRQLSPVSAAADQDVFILPGLAEPALITLNGTILQPRDFAISGETVTLAAGVNEGDEIGAVVFA